MPRPWEVSDTFGDQTWRRPTQLGTPARRPPELIWTPRTRLRNSLMRRRGAFCRRAGRVPAQLAATLSCGTRASVPLRLSSSGQGDSVTGVQGFFATTRLAAKAGKQPCSAAPWQTDVSDRPECMTGLTDPRHRCPSVFHGSTPAVGQAARYGAGGGWTRSATASALPKEPGLGRATPAATRRSWDSSAVAVFTGCRGRPRAQRWPSPGAHPAPASSLGPAPEERSAGCPAAMAHAGGRCHTCVPR